MMERKQNETFAAYKARRHLANIAVKNINRKARSHNGPSARAQLRETMRGFSIGIKGMAFSNFTSYGAGLRNRFDASMGMRRV